MGLKIKFYGTRGSIPVCGPEYQEFGGNTTCLQIMAPDSKRIGIIDAGTGIRELGKDLTEIGHRQEEMFISFTHFHSDHIQGFLFFSPAYRKKMSIKILALGKGRNISDLKDIFDTQMQEVYFPVCLDAMGANFEFLYIEEDSKIFKAKDGTNISVTAIRHNHPGGAFTYRFERQGKTIVFCTDIEHTDGIDQNVVALSQGADLLIHDAQYTKEELRDRKGWGHSSYDQALEVAEQAGVKQLVMTHHDPNHDDYFLKRMEKLCQERFKACVFAREKMEFEL